MVGDGINGVGWEMVLEPMLNLLCGEAIFRIPVEESNVEVGGVVPVFF